MPEGKSIAACSVDGCGKPAKARGWCATHYMGWYKCGDPVARKPRGIDLTGTRVGRWVVDERKGVNEDGHVLWAARCDCGTRRILIGATLRTGNSNSCGCLRSEQLSERGKARTVHGHASLLAFPQTKQSGTYNTWLNMHARCENERHESYPRYGARGITVCSRWRDGEGDLSGFQCFLADMGVRPEGRSIDRIDNDGNYEPGNCRWATRREQMLNTSRSIRAA